MITLVILFWLYTDVSTILAEKKRNVKTHLQKIRRWIKGDLLWLLAILAADVLLGFPF